MRYSKHFELAYVECIQFGPQSIIPQRALSGGNRLVTVHTPLDRPVSDFIFRAPADGSIDPPHPGEEKFLTLATVTILTIVAFGESRYISQLALNFQVAERLGIFDEMLEGQHPSRACPLSILGLLFDKHGVDQVCAPYRDGLLGVAERLLHDSGGFASFIALWQVTIPSVETAMYNLDNTTVDLVGCLEMTSEHLIRACRWHTG